MAVETTTQAVESPAAGDPQQLARSSAAATALVQRLLDVGIEGAGPFKSAERIAAQHLAQHGDRELAIRRLIRTHRRVVTAGGFVTGFGGFAAMPVTLPADMGSFYTLSTRCVAAIAHLRGYDVHSDEVRSLVLISLIGAAGSTAVSKTGIEVSQKAALSALNKLPGQVLIDINKKVGFRLLTKFGQKGSINLVRGIPVVGGGVGAGFNAAGLTAIARHASANFPAHHTGTPRAQQDGSPD